MENKDSGIKEPSKAANVATQNARSPRSAKRSVTITKGDFDNAIKTPWSVTTCILAQTAKRYGLRHNTDIAYASDRAMSLRNAFDDVFNSMDPNKKALAELRAKLPMTVPVKSYFGPRA